MSVRIFVGDNCIDAHADVLLAEGRGPAYGDGVFETMRVTGGCVPWWPGHVARMVLGAERLRITLPSTGALETALNDGLRGHREGVLKLMVTRGTGGRGYGVLPTAPPVWWLMPSSSPLPSRPGGLHLRWCDTRLAQQPLLAGIKHCNRLEQVLARAEWTTPDIDEGLMRDTAGDVVAATAANLFVLRDGRWWTPPVDRCGIAGVCRSWALRDLGAGERRLGVKDVETADAVILTNAVRGILPVARLGERVWSSHPMVAAARRRLAAAHPAFAVDPSEDAP